MRISVELPSDEEQMNGFEMGDQHNDQTTLLNESPLRLVTEKTSSERYTGPLSALLSPLMFHSEDSSSEEDSDSSDTEDDSITDLSSSSEDENSISSVEETSEKSKKQEPEKGLLESDNQDDGKVNNRNNERNQKTRL
uniref:Dentin sialophosphoprotein-like n=1 Tax=Caenorhabditis tropicalis TaxID=1561998 RepID=A0A1I7UVP7_9PELO